MQVSTLNGNLSYSYPISNHSIDGQKISVDLIYTSNASYTCFDRYYSFDLSNCSKCDGWGMFTKTQGAWIIGVNGFAIQVFKYVNRFSGQDMVKSICYAPDSLMYECIKLSNDQYFTEDEKFVWLLPGYDYCNRMQRLNSPDDQDVIKILKSDGSLLELRNPTQRRDVSNDYDPSLYVGLYYENGINKNGFAKVEFDTLTYWPSYFKKYAPDGNARNELLPRVIRYYPGNGLEYVFKEHPAPYGTREYYFYMHGGFGIPSIFYLEEIRSSMGLLTTFKRTNHYPTDENIDVTRGRGFIIEFAGHTVKYGDYETIIQSFGKTIKLLMGYKVPSKYPCKQYDYGLGSSFDVCNFEFMNSNLSQEEEFKKEYVTPYGFSQEYGFIHGILDPENRKTTFGYKCYSKDFKGFGSPYKDNLEFSNLRLDTIIEPTKKFIVEYYEGDGIVNKSDILQNENILMDFDLLDVVKSINSYEVVNQKQGELLQTYNYFFEESPLNNDRITSISRTDKILNLKDSLRIYHNRLFLAPYKTNEHQPYFSPNLYFTFPYKTLRFIGNQTVEENTELTRADNLSGGKSKYSFLPVSKEISIKTGESDPLTIYKKFYDYEFTTINDFENNENLSNAFGQGISKYTVRTVRPDEFTENIFKVTEEFLNLPIIYNQSVSRNDTIFDYVNSSRLTDSLRALGIDTTVIKYKIYDIVKINVPPLWNLPTKTLVFDKWDNLLAGKINTYFCDFEDQNPTKRRGSLLSDSIIGKYGYDTLLSGKYSYKGGWFRNFLSGFENNLGSVNKVFYNFSDVPGSTYDYPVGKKLRNDNSLKDEKLFKLFPQIESPISAQSYIRKYNSSGNLIIDTMTTYIEKTNYGLTGAVVDPNGWYWANEYDRNGRVKYIWHPFDFPVEDNENHNLSFEECIKLHSLITIIKKRIDTLNYSNRTVTHGGGYVTRYSANKMQVGNETSWSEPFSDSTSIQDSLVINNKYTTKFKYIATNNAATAYFRKDGSSLVIDKITRDIIQISDRTRHWLPDKSIINPYVPKR